MFVNHAMMDGVFAIENKMAETQQRNITKVINDYSKRLMGFIRKRVTNQADAEDILQDVFYQFIGNATPVEQLTSWLFTVARNKITDRKRKKKPDLLEDIFNDDDGEEMQGWAELFFDDTDNPETAYLRSMFWDELNDALNELPDEQKKVFVMNELEGIPFKEIAEQTGETVNTLISRKRYAVLHLRERLSVLREELLNY